MTPKVIVSGKAQGRILKTNSPINFLGSVDKKTGVINDKKHELAGKSVAGFVLAFPHGVGSSVGAYTIYSLKSSNAAPNAMICTKTDLTVASGCALANIPLVIISQEEFDKLENGKQVILDTDTRKIL